MDWIFTYQYELMYSFGALFALFSMMSYVVPAVGVALERGENRMDSSENFFEGFESLDLSSIMSDDSFEEDYAEEPEVTPFTIVPSAVEPEVTTASYLEGEHELEIEAESVEVEPVVVEEPAPIVKAVEAAPVLEQPKVEDLTVEKVEVESFEITPEDTVVSVKVDPTSEDTLEKVEEKVSVVAPVEVQEASNLAEEDEEEESIDYFSQSSLDVSGMSIEEDEEEKYSAGASDVVHHASDPVVDGFTKRPVAETASFDPVKEEALTVSSVRAKKQEKEEVLKVTKQSIKEDLLVMHKREKLSIKKEEVLSLKMDKGSFGDD